MPVFTDYNELFFSIRRLRAHYTADKRVYVDEEPIIKEGVMSVLVNNKDPNNSFFFGIYEHLCQVQYWKAVFKPRRLAEKEGDEKPIITEDASLNIALKKFLGCILTLSSMYKDPKYKPSERDAAEYPKSRSYPSKLTSLGVRENKATGPNVLNALNKMASDSHEKASTVAHQFLLWAKTKNRHFNSSAITEISTTYKI
ncbi:MAG: hypothetical protein Q8M03_12255 [Legionella sp.]|nr:hypothetical protein [Legionella sp.]